MGLRFSGAIKLRIRRPFGTLFNWCDAFPALEAAGYFQVSLTGQSARWGFGGAEERLRTG